VAWIGLHPLDYRTVLLQALTGAYGQRGQLFAGACDEGLDLLLKKKAHLPKRVTLFFTVTKINK